MEREATHRASSTLAAMRLWLASLRAAVGTVAAAIPALDGLDQAVASLADEMAASTARSQPPTESTLLLRPLEGLSILTLDDDANMREGMTALLTQLGARVRAAATVAAALRLFMTERPDLIISDLEVDGEDGAEFLRDARLQSTAEGRVVPAIALTGERAPGDPTGYEGFDVYLAKPPALDEMLDVIRTLAHLER